MKRSDLRAAGLLAAACVVMASVQSATGQMSFVSRESRVYAWEHLIDLGGDDNGVVSGEVVSTNLLSFDRAVNGGGYTAQQASSISSSVVVANCTAYGTPQSMGWGGAESRFTLVFDVSGPASFRLEGAQSRFIGDAIVSLSGPGTNTTIYSNAGNWPGTTPFVYEGIMSGGRYTFEVIATADFGSVQAALTVIPSPTVAPLLALLACARRPRR